MERSDNATSLHVQQPSRSQITTPTEVYQMPITVPPYSGPAAIVLYISIIVMIVMLLLPLAIENTIEMKQNIYSLVLW